MLVLERFLLELMPLQFPRVELRDDVVLVVGQQWRASVPRDEMRVLAGLLQG